MYVCMKAVCVSMLQCLYINDAGCVCVVFSVVQCMCVGVCVLQSGDRACMAVCSHAGICMCYIYMYIWIYMTTYVYMTI